VADELAIPVIRAFWAIDLPQELKTALGALQERLRTDLPPAHWPPPENFHLTLAFLGNIPETALPQALEAGRQVATAHRPFSLHTTDLGAFPDPKRARILWLGLQADASLARLVLDLQQSMGALGLNLDDKPFIPHLTLARMKSPVPIHLDAPKLVATVHVQELVLFQSASGPRGSIYTPLGTSPLG